MKTLKEYIVVHGSIPKERVNNPVLIRSRAGKDCDYTIKDIEIEKVNEDYQIYLLTKGIFKDSGIIRKSLELCLDDFVRL